MSGLSEWFKSVYRRFIKNEDLLETENEVLQVLAEGKGRESRAWSIVAKVKDSESAKQRAYEAALQEIRLSRMVNGGADLYSYGRGRDEDG